jgi:hypothetical protein
MRLVASGAKDLEIVPAITSGQVDTLAVDCDEPSGSTTLKRPRLYRQGTSSAPCPPCSRIPTGSTPVGIISDHSLPGPRAPKNFATRFYQLRMKKAPTGPYLGEIRQAMNDKCWWSGSDTSQTREHLFTHCRRWKDQQASMWRDLRKVTNEKWMARNTSMAQMFGHERCTAPVLEFLEPTEVGMIAIVHRTGRGGS